MTTAEQTAEGVARMSKHLHGTPLDKIVNDVYDGMKALEPAPIPPPTGPQVIFAPTQLSASFIPPWHDKSVRDAGCTITAVTPASVGIPMIHSPYVMRARMSGSSSGYARTHFEHADAKIPFWGEGSEVWYEAYFFLPAGFYANKTSTKDLMRWDCYVNGVMDMQGGVGMASDHNLYIMSNYPYTRPIETSYRIPEGKWTLLGVHQIISEKDNVALNEIYIDKTLLASSRKANYKGTAYPANERAINRLRVGLVSEGTVSDDHTLYFDKFEIRQ